MKALSWIWKEPRSVIELEMKVCEAEQAPESTADVEQYDVVGKDEDA
jgi:hypothetical protein